MPRVHTHYDNLKVPRDAPAEAIRTAYRALTRRHHPDRNPDDADAERVMAIVNVAYSVLSDRTRREEHDAWIANAEREVAFAPRPVVHATTAHVPVRPRGDGGGAVAPGPSKRSRRRQREAARARRRRLLVAWGGATVLGIGGLVALERLAGSGAAPVAMPLSAGLRRAFAHGGGASGAAREPGAPLAVRWSGSPLAPNGRAWPTGSGYVEAYPQLNKTGLSDVVADNRRGGASMFVKLVALDGPTPLPVRTFLVAPEGRFTLANVTSGTYDLRYRNLATGLLVRTAPFILEEVSTPAGLQHSSIAIELDAPGQGSPRAYLLTDNEF